MIFDISMLISNVFLLNLVVFIEFSVLIFPWQNMHWGESVRFSHDCIERGTEKMNDKSTLLTKSSLTIKTYITNVTYVTYVTNVTY